MRNKIITRRNFLAFSGAAIASCACGCAGLEVLVNQGDNPKTSMTIGFPEFILGDARSKKKILVAYASEQGSTGGVAERVARALAADEVSVDLRQVRSSPKVESYNAVVLGSAIHGGKWLPEASEFLDGNKAGLRHIPTAFFLVGLMANKKSPSDRKLVDQFLAKEREAVAPVAEGRFVGALFIKDYPGVTGFGMRFFIAYCGLGFRGGDFRDPAVIQAWAESIRPLLIS